MKILRIQDSSDEPGAVWIERYFLKDKIGRYRELVKIPGNHQYCPGVDEILAWFNKLGITHVEVTIGWHDSVPARTYPLKIFEKHLRRISND